jgi:hypothetical protein
VIQNNRDAAYALVKNAVTSADFDALWMTVRTAAEGATSYETTQIGWRVNVTNGVTTNTTAYQVYFDNGRNALLQVITQDGIEGIARVNFSDTTDFVNNAKTVVPTARLVLFGISVLIFVFTAWMFIDCLRRKMRRKVLWAILIFCGVAFTVTVGQRIGIHFSLGLMLSGYSVIADPSISSIVTKVTIPVGAIVYLCLRRKLTIVPPVPVEEPVTETETAESPAADEAAQPTEPADSDV